MAPDQPHITSQSAAPTHTEAFSGVEHEHSRQGAVRLRRPPRVRDQARDAVTLMAFSAATSAALATALVLLSHLGRQG